MHLSEIKLSGFKSFADTTRLHLPPDLTAVVGPNGCGKSNIADAIRWVLGEQSAKSLRGESMQDVIFGGAEKRKALPYAEVVLTFRDCEDYLGAEYPEVEVTRRVHRDGGGEYRINGRTVRRKDLQRLFMDTGMGRVAYSFLVQGQVDQILSSNPTDRRIIFEEAAGISKYKSQRREALNKLALVDGNLARVADILAEVSRQMGTLRRQASKALRYRRVRHRCTFLEQALQAREVRELDERIAANEQALARARATEAGRREEVATLEGQQAHLQEQRAACQREMEGVQDEVYEQRSAAEAAAQQIQLLQERRKDFEQRRHHLGEEIERIGKQRAEEEASAEEERQTRQAQLELLTGTDAENQRHEEAVREVATRLADREASLRTLRDQLRKREETLARLRSEVSHLELELKSFEVRQGHARDQLTEARNERERLEREIGERQEDWATARRETAEAEQATADLRAELEDLRTRHRDLQADVQEEDRHLARLAARRQVLQDLQDRLEGYGEGTRQLLQSEDGPEGELLNRLLQVEPGTATAVEALLGEAAGALLLAGTPETGTLLASLRESGAGRTALLDPSLRLPTAAPPTPAPPGLRPALEIVRGRDEAIHTLLEVLLTDCFLADSEDDFLRWRREHPEARYHQVATPEGTVFGASGLILRGHSGGEDSSLLGREEEIRRIDTETRERQDRWDRLRAEAHRLRGEAETCESRLEAGRQEENRHRQERDALERSLQALRKDAENRAATIKQAQAELEKLEGDRDRQAGELAGRRRSLEREEATRDGERQQADREEEAIARLREEREERQAAWNQARMDHAGRQQALQLAERGLSEAERRTAELQRLQASHEAERETLADRIQQTHREEEQHEQARHAASGKIGSLREKLETEREKLRGWDHQLETTAEKVRALQKAREEAADALREHELALARDHSRRETLLEQSENAGIADLRGIDPRRALWEADRDLGRGPSLDDESGEEDPDATPAGDAPEPDEEELAAYTSPDWQSLAEEAGRLRSKLQSMGSVNLVAIEEYRELRERHAQLQQQSEDLWQSKEELVRAIDEINETSQTLFAETFAKIRENFRETYQHLTGGGEGDLELIEAESGDTLEAGVEIRARPPGVRTSSLSLLSGGQRTMAAVALLFAIYRVKPSPFCVLDELDAPLDDANVVRFTEMLQQFTRFSQFLVITHNKRTIAAARSIYGVTMQEKGVSQLVSMRFNQHTEKAEAMAAEPAGASPSGPAGTG